MKFFTQFLRPDFDDFNPGGGEVLTESAGYIPIDKQITDMINAGQRLGDYRKGIYDYDGEEEIDLNDVKLDPTRDADFDEGDALRALKVSEEAYRNAKELVDKVDSAIAVEEAKRKGVEDKAGNDGSQ